MKLVVGIATSGRSEILKATLGHINEQSRKPDRILICPATPTDIGSLESIPWKIRPEIIHGEIGSSAQRNAILAACQNCDLLAIFDDDFFPASDYLQQAEAYFMSMPDVIMATGDVIADGVKGPGIPVEEAEAILNHAPVATEDRVDVVSSVYGCNMVLRISPIHANQLRFDEALPLYGWLEDMDFSRRVSQHGTIIKTTRLRGVHLATKNGRTSGLRIGYSQIANPIYLCRKGTMEKRRALVQICGNLYKNTIRALRSEPWIDRKGRLHGNVLALVDLLTGHQEPNRILSLHAHTSAKLTTKENSKRSPNEP